ncbi:TPM domain-containing protein [Halpernia sp. GG3]
MRSPSLKRFLTFLLIGFNLSISAQNIPKKPAILYPVYDQTGILTAQEKETLNQKLIKFSDSTSTEIEVIIIPTTGGQDVNFLATMYGEQWKIGQKGIDNGIVFLIATNDHTMSIQQGRAVETFLTASVAGQIMDYLVTPAFKKQQYFTGIDRGTNAIMEAVQGKFKPIKKPQKEKGLSYFQIMLIVFVIIFLFNFFKNRGGGNNNDDDDVGLSRKGRNNYSGGFFPFPIGGGGFGGGFGGGSESGGGFGGFGGGGSFGGGGASGGW